MTANRKIQPLVILFIIVIMSACGEVRHFERWEEAQQRAAEDPVQTHFEDEFVQLTFSLAGEKDILFRLQNKTAGRITIRWNEVTYKLPSGDVMTVVHRGDGTDTVIGAMSAVSDILSPVGRLPYLTDEDRWKDADGSFDFQQEFAIGMPLEIEVLGGKKDYTFHFDID